MIRSGGVELLHGGQVVDVLEPGEAFGHPSLLTGMAPAFTVRAHEPTTCLLVPRGPALVALGHPEGASFIALSLRERMVRAGHSAHALPALGSTHVGALVSRPPLFVDTGATAGEAARAMTAAHARAALVRTPDGLGVVTDADLRERVLAAGRGPDAPLAAAIRTPVLTIGAGELAAEALVALLDAGVQEICVLRGDGEPAGILTAPELVRAEHDPFMLRHELARAPDADRVAETARAGLPRLLAALLDAGLDAGAISRVLSVQSDAATVRLLELSLARHGPAPAPWAWFALGSVARRELTLASDQDNALAYADDAGPDADAYFAAVAADVNAGLAACGFGADRSGVLARDSRWRMPEAAWRRVLRECLEHPDRSRLVRAAVAFDFRHVAGGLAIVPPLAAIIREAPRYPDFIRQLGRTAVDPAVSLPRFRHAPATVDLKRGAVLPLANLARYYALGSGVTISATLDRLAAAHELGALDDTRAAALREAFLIVSRARFEHHGACVREGRPPDNVIAPAGLPPLARGELLIALRAIADAQKKLVVFAPLNR